MEHMDLGALIVAGIFGIGLIQFITWLVVIIRHPGIGDLRLDLVKTAPSRSNDDGEISGTQSGRRKH
ncbi:MAG TPA: hypothetical protein VLE46_01345 [Nitrospira sp.]|nr:hypothetical protein [Nitrospira sp.]